MHLEIPVCIAPPGFLFELFVSVSLILFVFHLLRLLVHLSFCLNDPCESFKLYQPSNLGICYCWIYSVTPIDCSRLRDSQVPKIEKARTRKREETGERKGGANASALPIFLSPALIFSCVFHLRVIPTIWEAKTRVWFHPVRYIV